jgi:hypothetical protein
MELDTDHGPGFSNSQDILIKLLLLYISPLERATPSPPARGGAWSPVRLAPAQLRAEVEFAGIPGRGAVCYECRREWLEVIAEGSFAVRRICRWGLTFSLAMAAPASTALSQPPRVYYNRVDTPRRESTSGKARGAVAGASEAVSEADLEADPVQPYTSRTPGASAVSPGFPSQGREPRSLPSSPSRTTQHSYYPGLKKGQSVNRNVVIPGPRKRGRSSMYGGMYPGSMGMGIGMGMSPPARTGAGTAPSLSGGAARSLGPMRK